MNNDVSGKREKVFFINRYIRLRLIPRITNTDIYSLSLSHRLDPISNDHHAIRPLTRKAHLKFPVCIYTKHLEIKYLHIVLNKRKNA